jgi:flagellar biogenesis protein FliO
MSSETLESVAASGPAWRARFFAILRYVFRSVRITRREKTLRVCEALPLGDKRFVALIQCEDRRFLIAGTQQSISLLDRLDSPTKQRPNRGGSPEHSFSNGVH